MLRVKSDYQGQKIQCCSARAEHDDRRSWHPPHQFTRQILIFIWRSPDFGQHRRRDGLGQLSFKIDTHKLLYLHSQRTNKTKHRLLHIFEKLLCFSHWKNPYLIQKIAFWNLNFHKNHILKKKKIKKFTVQNLMFDKNHILEILKKVFSCFLIEKGIFTIVWIESIWT